MVNEKLRVFFDDKVRRIEEGPEVCFGLYYAAGLPHDRRLPIKVTPVDFANLGPYMLNATEGKPLSSAAIGFDTFVRGSRARVGCLLAYNRRVVEEMLREAGRSDNPTMLVSTLVKDRFRDDGGFFIFTLDKLKKAVQAPAR
jgi:hypothetical protein